MRLCVDFGNHRGGYEYISYIAPSLFLEKEIIHLLNLKVLERHELFFSSRFSMVFSS